MVKEVEFSIHRSRFSIAKTALSHLRQRNNKTDFVIGLINGFASQINPIYKDILAQNVSAFERLIQGICVNTVLPMLALF